MKERENMENENQLLMVDHPERGIWYFTNLQKAADWIGIQRNHLNVIMHKKKPYYKGYELEWVDGADVIYRYINPEK